MDLKLTFLGRAASRWRVRVELAPGFHPQGLTVVLWGEDGKPLGPAVVAPANTPAVWEVELAGPVPLPPGTQVRCMADIDGAAPEVCWLGVDRRRGLHAFLHADGRLQVDSTCDGAALVPREVELLARAFPWVRAVPVPTCGTAARPVTPGDELSPALRDLLKDEFGVDVDALDDDLLD
jgi:hypothetical protein